MSEFFHIEMLPAGYGDCLWIEYGDSSTSHRILIDGGLGPTLGPLLDKIENLKSEERNIDLLVCTHIDLDHISGLLGLLRKLPKGLEIGEVWFNGWEQIRKEGLLGVNQGIELDDLIAKGLPRNTRFKGGAVVIPDQGDLPVFELPGGMTLTVLGPTSKRLAKLASVWEKAIAPIEEAPEKHVPGLLGTPNVEVLANSKFVEDSSEANGSSIVLLLEFAGRSALLTGDAFPSDVLAALQRWNARSGKSTARLDAFKLSHHGGSKNTSTQLLRYLHCSNYLVSTSGVRHKHPGKESIARILVHAPKTKGRRLHFNYRTEENKVWDDPGMKKTYKYDACYPEEEFDASSPAHGKHGLLLEIIPKEK